MDEKFSSIFLAHEKYRPVRANRAVILFMNN